jgi:hypothetical protein
MALMLDAGDIMSRLSPIEAQVFLLDCLSRLSDEVELGEESRFRLAFDLLASIRMKVYD